MNPYILKTDRLGLRNWQHRDLEPFVKMCKDEKVMMHFPKKLSTQESSELIGRLQIHYEEYGYCYFAVDLLQTQEFIGFIGLMNQNWESNYTPCVDIGWRLKQSVWGQGLATEGAIACLEAAFSKFELTEVLAFATDTNQASENIMKKIGMQLIGTVKHPLIIDDLRFKHCVVYKKTKGLKTRFEV